MKIKCQSGKLSVSVGEDEEKKKKKKKSFFLFFFIQDKHTCCHDKFFFLLLWERKRELETKKKVGKIFIYFEFKMYQYWKQNQQMEKKREKRFCCLPSNLTNKFATLVLCGSFTKQESEHWKKKKA